MDTSHLNDPIIDAADGVQLDPAQFVVFDNDGLTPDRYTIFPYFSFPDLTDAARGAALALSLHPDNRSGVSQWVDVSARAVRNHTVDLGRRIAWADLPEEVRTHIRTRLSAEGGTFEAMAPQMASLDQ